MQQDSKLISHLVHNTKLLITISKYASSSLLIFINVKVLLSHSKSQSLRSKMLSCMSSGVSISKVISSPSSSSDFIVASSSRKVLIMEWNTSDCVTSVAAELSSKSEEEMTLSILSSTLILFL